MTAPCSGDSNGTWTCPLTRPGGYVAKAVWNTKGSATYAPGPGYAQVRDLIGAVTPIPPGGSVAIGAKPVLVEGSTLAPPGAPNIVLVLTDDQDVQSGMLAYMPHLQELLVGRGTSFPNNMVPLSLCCPSRTTILRGQYPHNTGVLGNSLPSGGFEKAYNENVEASTVATLLHGAGLPDRALRQVPERLPRHGGRLLHPAGLGRVVQPDLRRTRTASSATGSTRTARSSRTAAPPPTTGRTSTSRRPWTSSSAPRRRRASRSSCTSRHTRRIRPTRRPPATRASSPGSRRRASRRSTRRT